MAELESGPKFCHLKYKNNEKNILKILVQQFKEKLNKK